MQIQELLKEGKCKTEISKILKVCRAVAIKYSNKVNCFETSTNCIFAPYIPLIKELIIKEKVSLLNSRLKEFRQEVRTNTIYLKRSQIQS